MSAYVTAASDCADTKPLSGSLFVTVVNGIVKISLFAEASEDCCFFLAVILSPLVAGPGDFGAAGRGLRAKLTGLAGDAALTGR